MLEELQEEGNLQYIEENSRFLDQTIAEAEQYKNEFYMKIDMAERKQWISRKSALRWKQRFHADNVLEWERKQWVTDSKSESAFPAMYNRWQKAARTRQEAVKLADTLRIDKAMRKEWADVLSVQSFLDMHYDERMHRASSLYAQLIAMQKSQIDSYKQASAMLMDAASPSKGFLHRSKVGPWLLRVMQSDDPVQYIDSVLVPCMERWEAVWKDYQNIQQALQTQRPHRSFTPVKPDAFLRMKYKKRTSYCALAWAQLQDSGNAYETNKLLAGLKLGIRRHLNTQDWEEAKKLLAVATKESPEDPELAEMQQYILAHEEESGTETERPEELLQNMRALVARVSSAEVQQLLNRALESGPSVFNRLAQVWSNRVWLREVGGWDEQKEQEQLGSNNQYMLDMRKVGTGTILHNVASHADEHAGSGATNLSANEHWGYWATLIPPIPYAEHRAIYTGTMWKLKKMLRSLHKQGVAYTSYGSAPSAN